MQSEHVPPAPEWKLNEFTFNDFSLTHDEMVLAGIRIFKDLGLMKTCRIEYDVRQNISFVCFMAENQF